MTLKALGINHRTADLDLRERVSFAPDEFVPALTALQQLDGVDEALIVSTCNRTEVYVAADRCIAETELTEWLAAFHDLPVSALQGHTYCHREEQAVAHAMRVASGLDSLVLGEPQIFGQFKQGYQYAQQAQSLGKALNPMFQHVFAAVKQVRTETSIGEHTVSVAYTAVHLAGRIFDRFDRSRALLIGAGETIALVARHLNEAGIQGLIIANRTRSRAEALAAEVGGQAIGLEEIPRALECADIVITSTASPMPILGRATVKQALKRRRHKPLFMADIAVPRDIEPEVGTLDDVFLYSLDDFNDIIDDNRRSREVAAAEAETVIETNVRRWLAACRVRDVGPLIRQHRQQTEQVRLQAEAQALLQLAQGMAPQEVIQRLSRQLTNKLLHGPTARLRAASHAQQDDVLAAARTLLIDDEANDEQGTRSR